MTQHTDLPVEFADIRVGDYVIGTLSGISVNEGYVTVIRPGSNLTVRQADGSEHNMGYTVRTFTRRTLASDPTAILTDPKAIVIGDTISIINGRGVAVESKAQVTSASNCGSDAVDFGLSNGETRCMDITGRTVYRHASAPQSWVPVARLQDLNPGDYLRATTNSNHPGGAGYETIEGTFSAAQPYRLDPNPRVKLDERSGMAYWFQDWNWTKQLASDPTALVSETWEPVDPATLRPGDYVRGGYSASVVQGAVDSVDTDRSLVYFTDGTGGWDFARTWTRRQAEQAQIVSARTLRPGDVVIAAPSGLGGRLKAQVVRLRDYSFTAGTLEVLEASSAGAEVDLSRGLRDPYWYELDQDVTLVSRAQAEDWPAIPTATWDQAIETQPTWHPIPFSALQVGDKIRATQTRADGTQTVQEGTITDIGGTRAYFTSAQGTNHSGTARRKWEVSNRVPDPQAQAQELYPTIHHLKAKLFDITLANYHSGAWCSDAHDFVAELGIAEDLRPEYGIKAHAAEVEALLAKLRGETGRDRGVSDDSIDRAFEALGIPRRIEPKTKRVQLEIEVPTDLTPGQISEMIASQQNVSLIQQQEVSR